MLPPLRQGMPERVSAASIRLTVVPLPRVPVTPATGPGQAARNSSVAEVMTAPASRAADRAG